MVKKIEDIEKEKRRLNAQETLAGTRINAQETLVEDEDINKSNIHICNNNIIFVITAVGWIYSTYGKYNIYIYIVYNGSSC